MDLTRRSFAALPTLAPLIATAAGANQVERVSHARLANGLEVVAIPDHRVPVATHMVWYRVGSADEEPGKSGLAHFLEHLMFKGTEKNPGETFQNAVRAVGGSENAFTSFDYTAYFQRIAREHLPAMMAFEADRMTGLVLTDAVVDPERDVVLEERKSRVDNDPGARLSERVGARLWGNHPYGIPIIGWENEIRGLTREDALAFYRRHYGPNNAILVVAGDASVDEIFSLAERHYGSVPANPVIRPRARPPAPVRSARDHVELADPRVAQPSVSFQLVVPSYATAQPREAETYEIISHAVGSRPNGRLFRALVSEQGLAASAGCFYSGAALGDGRFGLSATPRPGISFERIEAAIAATVATVVTGGITAAELARAKTSLVAESIFAQDSQQTMARMYGGALTTGSAVADVLDWVNRVRAVTLDDVQRLAARAFDLDRAVVGRLVTGGRG